MGLTLITPPTVEAVTLDEAKAHLRVMHTDEDNYISGLIVAACRHVEKVLSMTLTARTLRLTLDAWTDSIRLPRGPVQSVEVVRYVDQGGITREVPTTDYTVDLESREQWVVRNSDVSWPATLSAINVVSIDYVAGFDELPAELADLRHAILLLIGHWYAQREAVSGSVVHEVPLAVDALIQPYRWVLV